MKKRFGRGAALLLTLAMLLGLTCVPVSAAVSKDGYENTIYKETFTTDTLNTTLWDQKYVKDQSKDNAMYAKEVTIVQSPVDTNEHGYVARFEEGHNTWPNSTVDNYFRSQYNQVNSNVWNSGSAQTTAIRLPQVRVSMDVMFESVVDGLGITAVLDRNAATMRDYSFARFDTEGNYTINDGKNTKKQYELNKWYSFVVYVDFTVLKFTMYINGEEACKDVAMTTTDNNTSMTDGTLPWFMLSWGIKEGATKNTGVVYLDNISYCTPVDPTFEGVTPATNAKGFPVNGGQVEFAFSNPLDTTQTVTASVSPDKGASATIENNKVVVTNTNQLEFDTDYTFTIPKTVKDCNGREIGEEQSVTVHTMKSQAYGETIAIISSEENNMTNPAAKITVTNPGESSISAALVIAAYDANGNLIDQDIKKEDITTSAELTASLTGLEDADTIYVYAVDGKTLSKPLTPTAWVITADGARKMLNDPTQTTVTLDKFHISGEGEITVKGSVEPEKVTLVYINVTGPKAGIATVSEGAEPTAVTAAETEPSALIPVLTDENGDFELKYKPQAFVDGEYTVSVGGWQSASVSDTAYCLRQEVQDAIVNGVNGAETKDDVKDALAPYKTMLKVDASAFCDHVYQTLLEQKRYSSVDDVIEKMEKAQSLLKLVNSTNWADLAPILTAAENRSFLFKTDTVIETFAATEREIQNQICGYLTVPVDSFVTLRKNLKTAMDAYEEAQEQKKEQLEENQTVITGVGSRPSTSNSSKGSGASVSYASGAAATPTPSATPTPTPSTTVETPFADMKDAAWASEHVASLAEKGIISGDADGNFRPNDAVTREEFVKLLVGALGIEVGDAADSFTDADIDAWYAKYLAAAKAAGIITGNEDGTFGVGKEITRQDMAVMAVRAVNAIGKTLPSGGATFTDSDSISSYAAQAVGQMQEAGILNGIGNGTFAPMDSTSRAAAAKVIDSLMNLVIGK